MTLIPVSLLVLLVFTNRYLFGLYCKWIKGARFDETVAGYEPAVSIVVPMFNEGEGIYGTILSLLQQEYPQDKLEVIVIDDCSTDDSYQWALEAAQGRRNVTVLRNPHNVGKRKSIIHAVRRSQAEIIVSVDSDVVADRAAVRQLVARFTSPRIAAVGGRVNVSNANENWITRMQAIKYFFSYEYLKNLERAFHSVMCLSGCLTAYRRSVLVELEPVLEDRNVLGVPIKYGEDRYLTRQIIKAGYETAGTLDAVCYTVAPNTVSKYFSQQLRWRRSNAVDFFGGLSHAWKLHPFITVHYLSLFCLLLTYPLVIVDSVLHESFWELSLFHGMILALLGAVYRFKTRGLPAEQRVPALSFLWMLLLMPVTYVVYTPLALFTLDSGSWETRCKPQQPPQASPAEPGLMDFEIPGMMPQPLQAMHLEARRP